jgi:drug/metabolite transporter (DMT)-like permease
LTETRARLVLPFAMLTAILAVSTASIFIRFAQRDAPSLVIAALRLTFASLALAPPVLARHRGALRSLTRGELALGLLSGFFLAIHFATWISSLEYTTVASSVVLVSTGPLWVALLSPLILREPLTRALEIGMGMALLGGLFIALSDTCTWSHGPACGPLGEALHGPAMLGNFLALCGAWAVAGYLLIGRKLRSRVALLPYIFLVYGTAALCLLAFMLAAGQSPFHYQPETYVWIVLLALIPQLIGHSAYNWALAYLPASLVGITTLGEPIGSAILAYFILRETPAVFTGIGAALILAGIYVSTQSRPPITAVPAQP